MTAFDTEQSAAGPRRPPAAPTQWATVTRLGPGSVEPALTPVTAATAVEGSLALQVPAQQRRAPGIPETPELRLVGPSAPGIEDVQVWAARFAQAVVEVLGGDRPLAQLVRWTSQRVYLELDRRLKVLARTSDAGRRRRTVRPQVRSVHVFHPTPECAEVSVHVRHGERSRAIAARLELHRGRWQCTVLQLG
jgi:Family of unknown function (DUF6459)